MTVSSFLKGATPQIAYAIERGAPEINISFCSDLDIVIAKKDFLKLFELARGNDMVISTALSLGGARVFVSNGELGVKRIDFQWNVFYWGIPIADVKELLKDRFIDPATGLAFLPESAHAKIIYSVKNAYGGAEKYQELLKKYGYPPLGAADRAGWLAKCALSRPLPSLRGFVTTFLIYLSRLIYPSGLMVYGVEAATLRNSRALSYLFQGRIRKAAVGAAFIRSRMMSELCVVSSKAMADMDISSCADLKDIEQNIISFLRKKRSQLPAPVANMA